MMDYWPIMTFGVTAVFLAGGVYTAVKSLNGKYVRLERFEEFAKSIDCRLESIDKRAERIESWIDSQR